jgi:hypothetical protein
MKQKNTPIPPDFATILNYITVILKQFAKFSLRKLHTCMQLSVPLL